MLSGFTPQLKGQQTSSRNLVPSEPATWAETSTAPSNSKQLDSGHSGGWLESQQLPYTVLRVPSFSMSVLCWAHTSSIQCQQHLSVSPPAYQTVIHSSMDFRLWLSRNFEKLTETNRSGKEPRMDRMSYTLIMQKQRTDMNSLRAWALLYSVPCTITEYRAT